MRPKHDTVDEQVIQPDRLRDAPEARRGADSWHMPKVVPAQALALSSSHGVDPTVSPMISPERHSVAVTRRSAPDVPLMDTRGLPLVASPATRRRRRHPLLTGPAWTAVRLFTDLAAAFAALVLAIAVAGSAWTDAAEYPSLFAFPLGLVVLLQLRGLYRRRLEAGGLDELFRVFGAVSIAAMSVLAWEVTIVGDAGVGPFVGRTWVFALALVAGGRVGLALVQRRSRSAGLVSRPTLIVGAGMVGAQVARRLAEHPEYGLRPVGFIDADPPADVHATDLAPVLGGPEDLSEIVRETGAEHVIFAFSAAPDRGLIPLTRSCEELGLEVSLVPRLFESVNDRMSLDHLGGLPLIGPAAVDPKGWQFPLKYAVDRAGRAARC